MSTPTQAYRQLEVITPLGKDVLLLQRMTGGDRLSRPFEYHLEMISEDAAIDFAALLGENVTVRLSLSETQGERYFNGVVSDFAQSAHPEHRYAGYWAYLRPWLWFLTRTSDCRIFQGQTVPQIVTSVFAELGFNDFEDRLTHGYRPREYCVQYRETDFDFVSRLLEEEGIYYFFEHEQGKHTLILADDTNAHESLGSIQYCPDANMALDQRECIFGWRLQQQLQPVKYVLNDYDFKAPKKSLLSLGMQERPHAKAEYEIYDYPGEFKESSDGEHYSRRRIEELQARFELVEGSSNARGLYAGALFDLSKHPRDDQNKTFLITAASYGISSNEFESGVSAPEQTYQCQITVMDSQQPFRPARVTPRPVVQGPQTAVVTGPPGEEIHTDEYGRVKCQFHWDRYGERDENSSCWIRVSHPWAGKNWGAVAVPRIGQEVIVDFLEGDPDQPIITGRVYNGEQMPPYDLPANKTQTGIKSRSTLGGGPGNFNEIRFEDKKGSEHIFEHAERDRTIHVKRNEDHTVVKNRKKNVKVDETTEIGNNRDETVGNNETIAIGGNRTERVGGSESVTIGASRTGTVGASDSLTVGGSASLTVAANSSTTIGAALSLQVSASAAAQVGTSLDLTAGASASVTRAHGQHHGSGYSRHPIRSIQHCDDARQYHHLQSDHHDFCERRGHGGWGYREGELLRIRLAAFGCRCDELFRLNGVGVQ